jgi:hypothetical protein
MQFVVVWIDHEPPHSTPCFLGAPYPVNTRCSRRHDPG